MNNNSTADLKNMSYEDHLKLHNEGHEGASYELGLMHKHGRGAEKDNQKALEYFKTAKERNHPEAQKMIYEIENNNSQEGIPSPQRSVDETVRNAAKEDKGIPKLRDRHDLAKQRSSEAKKSEMDSKE